MRIRLPAGILLFLLVSLSGDLVQGQDYHEFTDKKGQKIMAALLNVSSDRRMMRIRRVDGQEFETQINVLSLDDQQYIKDWMKSSPTPALVPTPSEYRLEVSIDRKSVDTEKHKSNDGYSEYEQRFNQYEIKVQNLSRETLPAFQVEYVIVWRDHMTVYEDEDRGEMTYTSDDTDAEAKLQGVLKFAAMPFNRDEAQTTATFEINRMLWIGDLYREDTHYGIIVRVVTESGEVLVEKREGDSNLDPYTWKMATELPDPRVMD